MRLGHIGLTCSDLERSERFYEALGFRAFMRSRRSGKWLEEMTGVLGAVIDFVHMRNPVGVHLELLHYRSHAFSSAFGLPWTAGHMHFSLLVEDAGVFAPKGFDLDATKIPDGPNAGLRGFYMNDPDGHTIEISESRSGMTAELSRIIDKIEAARSQNNTNWCDLIRLCYRVAPDEARKIFRRIEKKDDEIRALAEESSKL